MTRLRVIQSLELSILSIFITVFCLTWSSVAQASDYSTLGIFELDGNNWSLEPLTVSNYPINAQVRITYNDGFFTNWDLDDPKPYWGAYAAESISVTDSDGSKSTLFYDDPSIRGYFSDPDELQRRMSNVSPFEFAPSGEAFDLWVWGDPGARADTATNRDGSVKLLIEYTRDVPHDHLPTMPPDTPPSTAMYTLQLPFYRGNPHKVTGVPGVGSHGNFALLEEAIDFAGGKVPVAASLGGTVDIGNDPDGLGHYVTIDHGPDPSNTNNRIFTLYAHLDENVFVLPGETVRTGQAIGTESNSGNTIPSPGGDGTHIHWDVYTGDPSDVSTPEAGGHALSTHDWATLGIDAPQVRLQAKNERGEIINLDSAAITELHNKRIDWGQIDPARVSAPHASISFAGSATAVTSDTGTINFTEDGVELATGSPSWVADRIEIEEPTNLLSLEADFFSEDGAQGLLSIYWDGVRIGEVLEVQTSDSDPQSYQFVLPETYHNGLHSVAFRLDTYSDLQSAVSIDGVTIGFVDVVPEPSSLVILALIGSGVIRRRPR